MRKVALGVAGLLLLSGAGANANPVGYDVVITTGYGFTNPFVSSTFLGGGTPSPDTGFVEITNSGTTTFAGTVGTVAASNFGGDLSFSQVVTLAPGQSVSIAIGNESSNVGGFNGPSGSVQPGVQVFLNGLFAGTEAVNLSVNDADIHSGVPRTNPFNFTLDNYVLQGGDPFGRDTGDGYETTQADGSFTLLEVGTLSVPGPVAGAGLPGLIAMCGGVVAWWGRRKSQSQMAI